MDIGYGGSAETSVKETELTEKESSADMESSSPEIKLKMVENFTEGFLSAFLPEVGNLQERLAELT